MKEINTKDIKIAYFSMEIALENWIKSYSGGLGVLAGDTLKSAADLQIPMLGVSILNKNGFFKQVINHAGEQVEKKDSFNYKKFKKIKKRVKIKIANDWVTVQAWQYCLVSRDKGQLPIFFLDCDLKENKLKYRQLNLNLYGSDPEYRLMQEIILGRAGVKILSAMGYTGINKYHLNEGHAALAAIELFLNSKAKSQTKKIEEVQKKCLFTTHTPIKAGHDTFPISLAKELQKDFPFKLPGLIKDAELNMTEIALYFSNYVNGVAFSHQAVSARMFPNHYIRAVTNGVHSSTWTSPEFQRLYDKYIPTWRIDSLSLRNAFNISTKEIWLAHQGAKQRLINYIYKKQKIKLDLNTFTIGFARRFTGYKRSTLLFHNMDELIRISKSAGPIQIIYAGKAHPEDPDGKAMIKEINRLKNVYSQKIKIIFLENYDLNIAKLMVAGVDVWLNTPLPPNEASGTSGMKAAHNGVPHFSTLDGWWVEGFVNRKTGWSIGERRSTLDPKELNPKDAKNLYDKLENRILPRYYKQANNWRETMRYTIAINASFFNSQRMIQQYIQSAYL